MNINHVPLLRPLTILILGILAASWTETPTLWLPLTLVFNGLLMILLIICNSWQRQIFFLTDVMIFSIGWTAFHWSNPLNHSSHFSFQENATLLEGKILVKEKTANAFRMEVKVSSVFYQDSIAKATSGNLLIYTKSDPDFQIGSTISFPAKYDSIPEYRNPGIFNYAKYLSDQNIFHSTFLKNQELHEVKRASFSNRMINNSKFFIRNTFESNLGHPISSGIANALIIGEKKALSEDVRKLFVNNGLAHLLAISGMHVGIILLIFQFLMQGIPFQKIRIILIILMVWAYILLTGMQIPAIRAGFMLTVYQIGFLLNRSSRSLNNVFFSAMVLLCLEPKMLFQISFQLSFCAMISIFIFYPVILDFFTPKKAVMMKLWQLIALNLSVQVFILPVSMFYFQQLPLYFLINSLISFPFIVLIMWGGIAALIISILGGIASNLAFELLDQIILALHEVLLFLNNLPFALIENIQISNLQLLFWITGIIGFTRLFSLKKFGPQLAAASFIPLILITPIQEILEHNKREVIIYDHPQNVVIDFEKDNNISRYVLNPIIENDRYYIPSPDLIYKKISNSEDISALPIQNHNIIIFNMPFDTHDAIKGNKFDICIPTSEIKEAAYAVLNQCGTVVIPRNFSPAGDIKNLKDYLIHEDITFYDINNDGAFIKKIKSK